jgi:hypothetical protein
MSFAFVLGAVRKRRFSEEDMKNYLSLKVRALIVVVVCGTAVSLAQGTAVANKKELLTKARQASYNLRSRGLLEFQATVNPNWRLVLKDQFASDPAKEETAAEKTARLQNLENALKLLNGIHFTVAMDPAGVVKVTHQTDVAAPNKQAEEGFAQIYSGMEQAMTGFFDTWKPFMLTEPFPEVESAYNLEKTPTGYLLSYKESNNTDVATSLSKDLVITEMKVTTSAFKSVLRPQFTRSPQGLLLTGYDATYDGITDNSHVVLSVQIENQEVIGQQLPSKLNLQGTSEGSPFSMELALGNYQVKNR